MQVFTIEGGTRQVEVVTTFGGWSAETEVEVELGSRAPRVVSWTRRVHASR